jgi:hypothetical protein
MWLGKEVSTITATSALCSRIMSDLQKKLPQATLDILQSSLEDFRKASKRERRAIISKCSKETLPAGSKKSDATQHKQVSHLNMNLDRITSEQ